MSISTSLFSFKKINSELIESNLSLLKEAKHLSFWGSLFEADSFNMLLNSISKADLESLDLSACQLKETDYEILSSNLMNLKGLQCLSIRSSYIAQRSLHHLFSKLKDSKALQKLDVSYLEFEPESSLVLEKLIFEGHISSLNLRYCRASKIEGIIKCALQNHTIAHLNLSCLSIPYMNLDSYSTSLKTLDVSSSYILEEDFISFHFINLESLRLDMMPFKVDKILGSFLTKHAKLSELSLICNNLGVEGILSIIEPLKAMKFLERLNLQGNDLTDSGCEILLKNLPETLKVLNLEHNHLTDASFDSLKLMIQESSLEEINLKSNPKLDVESIINYATHIRSSKKILSDSLC